MKSWFYITLLFIFFISCVEEVQIPFRSETVKLIVEGGITNDKPPYVIKLSYSGNLIKANYLNLNLAVSGARVTVTDNLGESVEFEQSLSERGVYRSIDESYQGKIGRIYSLKVFLKDGRIFESKPAKMLACPPIDSLYGIYEDIINVSEPDGYKVYLDTKDPANEQNYYRWYAYGYSRVGRLCGGQFCPNTCDVFSGFNFCWVPRFQTRIDIESDALVNGNPIRKRPVFFSPVYAIGKHFVEVTQFSISRDAYQFWRLYQEQSSRTGTIIDPLPAPIQGNVSNINDPLDYALGYFEVAGISRKRVVIYGKYDNTEVLNNALNFTPKDGGCSLSNASCGRPDGWPKD
jgi:Domain of unknown function (DUF4249)